MLKTPIGKLRLAGLLDGLSLIILICIGMPLKYWMDIPEVVSIVGRIHGGIVIVYGASIIYATIKTRWNLIWTVLCFAVAFIPFGNFFLDRKLEKLDKQYQ